MCQRSIAYKAFLICMVLFCVYMQWSPVIDLDYVWVNGHEHYVGAATPHQVGRMVVPSITQTVSAIFEDSAAQFHPMPLAQFAIRLAPPTVLLL